MPIEMQRIEVGMIVVETAVEVVGILEIAVVVDKESEKEIQMIEILDFQMMNWMMLMMIQRGHRMSIVVVAC